MICTKYAHPPSNAIKNLKFQNTISESIYNGEIYTTGLKKSLIAINQSSKQTAADTLQSWLEKIQKFKKIEIFE